MKCPHCGASHPSYAKFCAKCGKELPLVAASASTSAVSASEAAPVTPEPTPEPVAPSPASSSNGFKVFLLGKATYSKTRSLVMYGILGGSSLMLFVFSIVFGWSALLLIPLLLIGVGALGYIYEVNKIQIDPEALTLWNEKRTTNKIFKWKVGNPKNLFNKIQFWHSSFGTKKLVPIIMTVVFMWLVFPTSTIAAGFRTALPPTSQKGAAGGSSSKTREYKGFWPEAPYVVANPAWTDHLVSIWDEIMGRESYNTPLASTVGFSIKAEYGEESELTEFRGMVVARGFTLIDDTGKTIVHYSDHDEEFPQWYYEWEWGPETTWHYHRYFCSLKVADYYNNDWKTREVTMSYMYFDYGQGE